MFNSELRIRMETDVLGFILEIIISQLFHDSCTGREIWYSITFWLWKMTSAERNYKIYDKELLAVITAFKEWRYYTEDS